MIEYNEVVSVKDGWKVVVCTNLGLFVKSGP